VQIARIYAERRPVVLGPDEQRLYELSFSSLRPREFLSLAMIGEWKDDAPGDQLLKQGERAASLAMAVAGKVEIRLGQQLVATIAPGHVIGTALALVGDPSPVDARFCEPGRYLSWPLPSLRTFIDKHPDLRLALQQLVSRDVAKKVEGLVRGMT
jgi:CRP-like cAMP-binding protein